MIHWELRWKNKTECFEEWDMVCAAYRYYKQVLNPEEMPEVFEVTNRRRHEHEVLA